MDPSLSLEREALKFCQQALRLPASTRRELHADASTQTSGGLELRVTRVRWLLPELAKLIARHHARPPRDFVLTVRRFVDERTFIEDAGDPVFDAAVSDEAQALVDASLRAHRAVHHCAMSRDDWHDFPVPPLMCG